MLRFTSGGTIDMSDSRERRRDAEPPQRRKDPTFWIGAMIILVVVLVLGTVLFNAISSKREYDREQAAGAADTSKTGVAASIAQSTGLPPASASAATVAGAVSGGASTAAAASSLSGKTAQ
jgi:predicted lipid-binding transport protein (Tim44 family)